MAQASSSSGRIPQGEVIMEFADGGSYIKHKLENGILDIERRRLGKAGQKVSEGLNALEVSPAAADGKQGEVKEADVDLIVKELGVTRAKAEQALREEVDVVKALVRLTGP